MSVNCVSLLTSVWYCLVDLDAIYHIYRCLDSYVYKTVNIQ